MIQAFRKLALGGSLALAAAAAPWTAQAAGTLAKPDPGPPPATSAPAGKTPATPALSREDKADVARLQDYLNGIHSIKSEFVQLSSGGHFARGMLYIERPDRLRLDYEPPATTQVYADGDWLIYVDTELESVTHVPMSSTPAGLLVRDKIRLNGDITVRRVLRGKGTITLVLTRTGEPDQGRFAVTFAEHPLQIQQWTVVDSQGVTTRVNLLAPQFNVAIPHDVFVFDETKYDKEMQ